MPKSIMELFPQKDLIDYTKTREFPAMMGEELFPETKEESLDFDVLTNKSKTPVTASVHAFDTEAEIGQREAEKMIMGLALIKRKMQLKEKDVIALQSPRNDREAKYLKESVYNDIDNLIQAIKARIEIMRMEIVSDGTVTLNENGLSGTIDYGVPTSQKVSDVDWSSTGTNPITDIMSWVNKMDNAPGRIITSNTVLAKLLQNSNITNALFGSTSTRIATTGELNTYLASLGLPQIYTYDKKYRKLNADGTYTKYRYFSENSFSMIPADTLGETIYGPTAEEIQLQAKSDIDIVETGKILAMIYQTTTDPVGTWEKAVATALPSCNCADDIFQAKIII